MPPLLVRLEQRRARRQPAPRRTRRRASAPRRGTRRPSPATSAREDLALVVLVVGAGRGAGSAAARGARRAAGRSARACPNCSYAMLDVVGPRQDLRVQALHVVALVERVDDGLPVRVDDRACGTSRKRSSLEAVRREQASGSGSRKSSSGSASGSRLTNTNPPQRSTRTVAEPRSSGRPANSSRSDDVDEPAVERVAPRVVAAADRRPRRRCRSRRRGGCPGAGTRCGTRASSPASVRTTRIDSSPIVYSRSRRARPSSSSRHAICHTRVPEPLDLAGRRTPRVV